MILWNPFYQYAFGTFRSEWQTHEKCVLLMLMLNILAIIPPWWGFNVNDTVYRRIYACSSVAVVIFPLIAQLQYIQQLTNRSRSFSVRLCAKFYENPVNTELNTNNAHHCSVTWSVGNINKKPFHFKATAWTVYSTGIWVNWNIDQGSLFGVNRLFKFYQSLTLHLKCSNKII